MRSRITLAGCLSMLTLAVGCQAGGDAGMEEATSSADQLNPMIALHEQGAPVLGLYTPRAAPFQRPGGPAPDPSEIKSQGEIVQETLGYEGADYMFSGDMEYAFDEAYVAFQDFMAEMRAAGATVRTHPMVVKMAMISEDPDYAQHIDQQLDEGVSGIMFVHVESAEELQNGLDAMRFQANGGTRDLEGIGPAAEYWGVTEEEYVAKADLWPLNPDGELINWTIIESLEGLENVREIAAVPGIGVLGPGAGTLRGVFSTTGADGERVVDQEAWENAIQTVLAACKEFDIACGYPANADDIEMRIEQGFEVFVMGWGDSGFQTIEIARVGAESHE